MPAGIIVPVFPQRSPPQHLAAAACGGLRSAPDCRTRRALLHLSYSYAPPVLHGSARVTRSISASTIIERRGRKTSDNGHDDERLARLNCAMRARREPLGCDFLAANIWSHAT